MAARQGRADESRWRGVRVRAWLSTWYDRWAGSNRRWSTGRRAEQGDEGAPDCTIAMDPGVRDGGAGRGAPGSELLVLTWLDRGDRDVQAVRPRGDADRRETGVFSTRSPDRPNPIGLHRVTVLDRRRPPAARTGSRSARRNAGPRPQARHSAASPNADPPSAAPIEAQRGEGAQDVCAGDRLIVPEPQSSSIPSGTGVEVGDADAAVAMAAGRARIMAGCRGVRRTVVKSQSAATRRPAAWRWSMRPVTNATTAVVGDVPVASMSTVDGQSRWCGPRVRSGLRRTSTVKPGTRKTSRWSAGAEEAGDDARRRWPGRECRRRATHHRWAAVTGPAARARCRTCRRA